MLQRIPLLRGPLLFLARLSSLNSRFTTARLLSSDSQSFKKDSEPFVKKDLPKQQTSCGGTCDHIRSKFKFYASAAALLLTAGLIYGSRKKKASAADQQGGKAGPPVTPGPFENDSIPEEIPYLLVGAGTASYYAALTVRARDPDAKVLIIGDERHLPYSRANLSKELWWYGDDNVKDTLEYKALSGRTKEVYYETKGFYVSPAEISSAEHGGVSLLSGHKVVKLDVPNHTAHLDDGRTIKYGKCLIATGLLPCLQPVFQNVAPEVKDKISTFQNVEDFKKLYDTAKDCKSITVVGSNILASELTYSLNRRFSDKGLKVNQVFGEKGVVAEILPEYLSKMASKSLQEAGVNVIEQNIVTEVLPAGTGSGVKLVLASGDELVSDHVVVAVDVMPNTELAKTSDLETDKVKGGFLVDAELRARSDVWVAGAVCNFYDIRLGRRRAQLYDDAQVTGRLAGENMTGGSKPYWHQAGFYSVVAPGVHFQGVGRADPTLPTVAVFASDEKEGEKPNRGVIFYLDEQRVVGVVLYNVFGYGIDVARRIIADGKEHDEKELKELAKLFELHKTEPEEEEAAKEGETKDEKPSATEDTAKEISEGESPAGEEKTDEKQKQSSSGGVKESKEEEAHAEKKETSQAKAEVQFAEKEKSEKTDAGEPKKKGKSQETDDSKESVAEKKEDKA